MLNATEQQKERMKRIKVLRKKIVEQHAEIEPGLSRVKGSNALVKSVAELVSLKTLNAQNSPSKAMKRRPPQTPR